MIPKLHGVPIVRLIVATLGVVLLAGVFVEVRAHPEDEMCAPGSALDPALCRKLAEIDRAAQDQFQPLRDESGEIRSALDTARLYFTIGIRHILPGGTDHILFVLALFLRIQPAVQPDHSDIGLYHRPHHDPCAGGVHCGGRSRACFRETTCAPPIYARKPFGQLERVHNNVNRRWDSLLLRTPGLYFLSVRETSYGACLLG